MKTIILILLISSPVYSMRISAPDLSAGKNTAIPNDFVGPIQPARLEGMGQNRTGATSTEDTRLFVPKVSHWHSDPGYYKHMNDFKERNRDMERTRIMGNR